MHPKENVEGLLTELHEKYAVSETSAEQDALMAQLQSQLAEWEGPQPPDGSIVTTAELLIDNLEERHPHLSAGLREFVRMLGRIGI